MPHSPLLVFGLFSLWGYGALAGAPAQAAPEPPFRSGEKAAYSITYLGATAGILTTEVLPPSGAGDLVVAATARTDPFFSLFYYLKDVYESTIDVGSLAPSRLKATLDESKQHGTTTQEFDQALHQLRLLDERDHKTKGHIHKDFVKAIAPGTQDVVSAIFYLRAQPLLLGKVFELPVFVGEESYLLRVTVAEEEDLPTKIGRVPAFILRPALLKDGEAKPVPDTQLWFAKEGAHELLKVKAKVKIGSVIAYLRSYEQGRGIVSRPAITPALRDPH